MIEATQRHSVERKGVVADNLVRGSVFGQEVAQRYISFLMIQCWIGS